MINGETNEMRTVRPVNEKGIKGKVVVGLEDKEREREREKREDRKTKR